MKNIRLNLVEIFLALRGNIFCIIKLDEQFPSYKRGADIDILCYDVHSVARELLRLAEPYISEGYEVQVTDCSQGSQIYVDFLINGGIEFRFDLYGELPQFNNLCVKPALFESIIENRCERLYEDHQLSIPIASSVDEAIIRYVEYHEWYASRPDKLKHIDYINKLIDSAAVKHQEVWDKLYHYTSFPPVKKPTNAGSSSLLKKARKLLCGQR